MGYLEIEQSIKKYLKEVERNLSLQNKKLNKKNTSKEILKIPILH